MPLSGSLAGCSELSSALVATSRTLCAASRSLRARSRLAIAARLLVSHEFPATERGIAPVCGGSDADPGEMSPLVCGQCRKPFVHTAGAVYVASSRSFFHPECHRPYAAVAIPGSLEGRWGAIGGSRPDTGSAALIDAVLATVPGETAIVDSAGTIVHVNEAWATAARSGLAVEHALKVGANYLDACRRGFDMPVDVARKRLAGLEAVLRGQRDELVVEYLAHRMGQDRWLEVRVRRLARPGGGAVVMRVDVTSRRHAEAAIQRHLTHIAHGDRVAAMGQLASSLAHELNQPLTAILTNAQAGSRLLAAAQPDGEELRACLDDIVSDGKRASEVIRRMRHLLTKTEFNRLPLALNDLIRSTIALVASDALLHAVSIDFVPAPTLPVAYGDAVQIQQVILNLLTNAIAAVGDASRRTVRVSTTAVADTYVEISVHDSGKGIAEGDLDRLFDPFFTTKPDGLGMGLAISRMIVEAHRGRLLAENDPAGGATFRIHLRTAADGS